MKKFSEICSGHCFVIPENQRGFSWGIDEVNDIFNDLDLADTQSHYMGPIIVTRTSEPDFQDDTLTTTAEFTLEDGQQRITTFFIIINEIKKKFENLGRSLEAQELERIIFFKKGQLHLRLSNKNPHLDASFSHIVCGNPPLPANPTAPVMALKKVSEYVGNKIMNMNDADLLTWKHRLTNQAKFIWVDLAAEGVNRYLTFDAINSRGLPLSEFDKIKNFCILVDQMRNLATFPENCWYKAITELENFKVSSRPNEAAFIGDLYNVFHDENISQGNVHSEFVKKYRRLLTTTDVALENDFRDFVSLWEKYAESFGFITTKSRQAHYASMCSAEASAWLDRIDNMELPTITRVILTSSHFRMEEGEFERVARACEIYTFRVYAVMRYRKDNNSKGIIKLANEVLRLNKDSAHVMGRICNWLRSLASLKQVILKLADGEPKYYYDQYVKGWQHCYYFLYEYEIGFSPVGVAPLPWEAEKTQKINSQEHILPQNHRDGAWWEDHWPNADEAEKYKHRLGNLVISVNNSALGRKSIDKKINDTAAAHYYNHPNASNSEKRISFFTTGTEWRPHNILKREVEMLEFVARRWSIPCSCDSGQIVLEDHVNDDGNSIIITPNINDGYEEEEELSSENGKSDDCNDDQI